MPRTRRQQLARWAGALAAFACLPLASGGVEEARAAANARLILERTPLHTSPGGKVIRRVTPYTVGGVAARLLVVSRRKDEGRSWLQLLLPTRPNGSTAWVRQDHVKLSSDPYEIRISTRSRRLQLLRRKKIVMSTRIIVGAAATPTPHGNFAVYDRYSGRGTPLAPWVLELTAHSNVLHEFAGGPGRVAIHGMTGGLRAPLGSAVSHGCIRVPTRALRRIARYARSGTPVRIVSAPLSKLAR